MKKIINDLHISHGIRTMLSLIIMALPLLASCDDDDNCNGYDITRPNAIVTVKTATDNTVYLQLDDSTTLYPENMKAHPFGGKEVRAFVNVSEVKPNTSAYSRAVMVNSIDSVLTKPTVQTLGSVDAKTYGEDPLEILKGFPTVCEDNYLTLAIYTVWGAQPVKHLVNLVTGVNPKDPYEVELRQNAYGDTRGRFAATTVAFSLKNLPSTGGKTVKLKVKFRSFSGDKTAEFDYRTK